MGGGKKKKSITQMAKSQELEERKSQQKGKSSGTGGSSSTAEKRLLGITVPNPKDKKIEKELQGMKVLTPYSVASRLNLRLSVARDFLEELQREGLVAFVSSGKGTRIYKPIVSS
jgi:small subunit ribosomal protein S25e